MTVTLLPISNWSGPAIWLIRTFSIFSRHITDRRG
jgi:hypothetical protein